MFFRTGTNNLHTFTLGAAHRPLFPCTLALITGLASLENGFVDGLVEAVVTYGTLQGVAGADFVATLATSLNNGKDI